MKKETKKPTSLREIAIDALANGDTFTLGRIRDYREQSTPNRMVHQVEGDPAFYDALGNVTTIPEEYREYHDEGRIVLWDVEKVLDIDAGLYWSMHHGWLKDNLGEVKPVLDLDRPREGIIILVKHKKGAPLKKILTKGVFATEAEEYRKQLTKTQK